MADLSVIKLPNNESYNLKDAQAREMINGKLLPAGGTLGQVLVKQSSNDYDVSWETAQGIRLPMNITIDTAPTKTSYEQTESFDPTGMVVTLHYSDGYSTVLDNNDLVFNPSSFINAGSITVTVTYTTGSYVLTATQNVTVTAMTINSFAKLQRAVDYGIAEDIAPVGTQLTDSWSSWGLNYALWDIVHYDSSGNVTLKWHYATQVCQFDAPEAIWYAPPGGLAAGQYYITIGSNYGSGWVVGQNINFTFPSALSADDQLVIDLGDSDGTNPTNGRTWNVYSKGSTTSKMSGTTSNSSSGTLLGSTHSTNYKQTNGNVNSPERAAVGYSRYSESAARQFLNSDQDRGLWWSPQNPWDRPPSDLNSFDGFIYGCSADLLSVLEATTILTPLNITDAAEEGASYESLTDRVFIPSLDQMYISTDSVVVEEAWDYYKDLAAESGLSGKFGLYGNYSALATYQILAMGSQAVCFLRTPYYASATDLWRHSTSITNYRAFYRHNYAPCCVIKKHSA